MKGKKISAHAAGAAIAAITVWCLGAFAKIPVPPEIAVAFGTVAAIVVSLIVPDEQEADE